jgi:hypothetical protein
MRLEQQLGLSPKVQIYLMPDGPGGPFDVTDFIIMDNFRYDYHEPFGEHINHEVLMPKIGSGEGRFKVLSNDHILLHDIDK